MSTTSAVLNTIVSPMTFLVTFVGIGLARHGHISWWMLVGMLLWGLMMGLSGFSAAWDGRRK